MLFRSDFVVLEMEDSGEAIILGRPFLATAGALIDVKGANITLRFGDEEIIFDMNHPSGLPPCIEQCSVVSVVDSCVSEIYEEKPVPLDKNSNIKNPVEDECHFAIYQIADDKEDP